MAPDRDLRLRLQWIAAYGGLRDAGAVCRRFGISRPTLRKWLRRYEAEGETGLLARSRPGLYQYAAIDDCSRYLVLGLAKRASAAATLAFLDQVLDEMPFRSSASKPTAEQNSLLRSYSAA